MLWKGLISPDYLPNDDEIANFKGSKGLIYRINYHSKRHVRATDSPVHKPQSVRGSGDSHSIEKITRLGYNCDSIGYHVTQSGDDFYKPLFAHHRIS